MRVLCVLLFLGLSQSIALAQPQQVVIGYLEQTQDPRYHPSYLDNEFQGQPWGRPFVGAEVALAESRFPAMAIGAEFSLDRRSIEDLASALETVQSMQASGIELFLLDLPADLMEALAGETRDADIALFNVSAPEDRLRQQACQPHMFHLLASHAMRNDALAQYLVSRQWRNVFVAVGPEEADRTLAESWRRSAERFGLTIVEERSFVMGNDPRERELNNPWLVSGGANYDVIYVADTYGEFARLLPYTTQLPRPVVGSGGLVAQDWHWAWSSHGAAQLNKRFEDASMRHGTGYDWAAWMAVKAIVEAMIRSESTDFEQVMAYLQGSEMILDSFKGFRLGFRSWNNQLRQPLMLGSGNWVVARPPLEGFLHQENYLDTLGFDSTETQCEWQ